MRPDVAMITETKRPSGPHRNMPAVHRVVRLTHQAARHVYARAYGICNRALYQMETMPRPPDVGIRVARLEREIDARFTELGRDLEGAVQRARQMLRENGIAWDEKPRETPAIEAFVSARRSAVYLGLLERFDALVDILEMAQCGDILSKKACREETYRWQRHLTRMAFSLAVAVHKEAGAWPRPGKE